MYKYVGAKSYTSLKQKLHMEENGENNAAHSDPSLMRIIFVCYSVKHNLIVETKFKTAFTAFYPSSLCLFPSLLSKSISRCECFPEAYSRFECMRCVFSCCILRFAYCVVRSASSTFSVLRLAFCGLFFAVCVLRVAPCVICFLCSVLRSRLAVCGLCRFANFLNEHLYQK